MTPITNVQDAALYFHTLTGINVLPIARGGKKPAQAQGWAGWQTTRQTAEDVAALGYKGADRIALLGGWGGMCCFDLDAEGDAPVPQETITTLLTALRLPSDYAWAGRSSSGRGAHVWVRLSDTDPAYTTSPITCPAKGGFNHLEIRFKEGNYTILPRLTGYTDTAPTEPPARVTWAAMLAAVSTVAVLEKPHEAERDAGALFDLSGVNEAHFLAEAMGRSDASLRYATLPRDFWVEDAISGVLAEMQAAGKGNRNKTLYAKAIRLQRFVAANRADPSVFDYLADAARGAGLPAEEISRTIASGRKADEAQTPETEGMPDSDPPATPQGKARASKPTAKPPELVTPDDVARLRNAVELLRAAPSQIGAMPLDLFPEPVRLHIEAVARAVGIDASAPATFALAALSTALQGRVKVTVQAGWQEQCNLYAVVMAPSGTGKTPAFEAMMLPIFAEQARLTAQYLLDRAAWKDGGKEGEEPVKPALYLSKSTNEGLQKYLSVQGGAGAVLSDEGGVFRHIAGIYQNTMPDIDVWMNAFDGKISVMMTATHDVREVLNPALTIGIGLQAGVLRKLRHRRALSEQGLFARMLIALAGRKKQAEITDEDGEEYPTQHAYNAFVTRLFQWAEQNEGGTTIPMTKGARELIKQYKASIVAKDEVDSESEYNLVALKADRQITRLAGVLAAAQRINAGATVRAPIDVNLARSAIRLYQFFFACVQRELDTGSPAEQDRALAQQCAKHIPTVWERLTVAHDGRRVVEARLIQQRVRGLRVEEIREGLTYLAEIGLLTEEKKATAKKSTFFMSELAYAALCGMLPPEPTQGTTFTEPEEPQREPEEPQATTVQAAPRKPQPAPQQAEHPTQSTATAHKAAPEPIGDVLATLSPYFADTGKLENARHSLSGQGVAFTAAIQSGDLDTAHTIADAANAPHRSVLLATVKRVRDGTPVGTAQAATVGQVDTAVLVDTLVDTGTAQVDTLVDTAVLVDTLVDTGTAQVDTDGQGCDNTCQLLSDGDHADSITEPEDSGTAPTNIGVGNEPWQPDAEMLALAAVAVEIGKTDALRDKARQLPREQKAQAMHWIDGTVARQIAARVTAHQQQIASRPMETAAKKRGGK